MNINEFNNLCVKKSSVNARRKDPWRIDDDRARYEGYRDVRGDRARNISSEMGIDEESGIKNTSYLVEIRDAKDHIRLSAHAASYFQEVMIFSDGAVIALNIDRVKEEATQTVYSPNGDVERLQAPWSFEGNGYQGPFERVSLKHGLGEECQKQWEKYESLLNEAQIANGSVTPSLNL